jgi:hypothetical protein
MAVDTNGGERRGKRNVTQVLLGAPVNGRVAAQHLASFSTTFTIMLARIARTTVSRRVPAAFAPVSYRGYADSFKCAYVSVSLLCFALMSCLLQGEGERPGG